MPNDIVFKAIAFGLIWFSLLLVVIVLLISHARGYETGKPFRKAFTFVLAAIGVCALIAFGTISHEGSQGQVFFNVVR